MKNIFKLFLLLGLLVDSTGLWAQRGSKVRLPAKTPTQLSAQAHAFVKQFGHRPRATITDANGLRRRVGDLNAQELEEVRLGNALNKLFHAVSAKKIAADPLLSDLYALLDANPNPRAKADGSYYIKRSRDFYIDDVIERTQVFLSTYQRLPRAQIFKDGSTVLKAEQTWKEQQEVLLAHQLNRVLSYTFEDPRLDTLRSLVQPYQQEKKEDLTVLLPQLKEEVQAFIAANGFIPRIQIIRKNHALTLDKMTPIQRESVLLARRVNNTIRRAQKDPTLSPLVEDLTSLLRVPKPFPTDEEILEQIHIWDRKYPGFRPRTTFYINHKSLDKTELTPEQYEQRLLGQRVYMLLKKRHNEDSSFIKTLEEFWQRPIVPLEGVNP